MSPLSMVSCSSTVRGDHVRLRHGDAQRIGRLVERVIVDRDTSPPRPPVRWRQISRRRNSPSRPGTGSRAVALALLGVPLYVTLTVNGLIGGEQLRRGDGQFVRCADLQVAAASLTVIAPISKPIKSRLNAGKSCVATASIVDGTVNRCFLPRQRPDRACNAGHRSRRCPTGDKMGRRCCPRRAWGLAHRRI